MIADDTLQKVAEAVEQAGVSEAVLAELRQGFPGVHFSYCMDDDVGTAKPVLERPGFNLYLVDGREHCLSLTSDPAVATGLLVAEVIEEPDWEQPLACGVSLLPPTGEGRDGGDENGRRPCLNSPPPCPSPVGGGKCPIPLQTSVLVNQNEE
jgi:hypothetical protein